MPLSLKSRLLKRIRSGAKDACWPFVGARLKSGYGKIADWPNTWKLAHRAAWTAFVGPIPEGKKVLHHCDNPPCCNWVSHLYVGTSSQNATDRETRNRRIAPHGETHNLAKLTEHNILEIRTSNMPTRQLANKFRVHFTTVHRVRKGFTWKHSK